MPLAPSQDSVAPLVEMLVLFLSFQTCVAALALAAGMGEQAASPHAAMGLQELFVVALCCQPVVAWKVAREIYSQVAAQFQELVAQEASARLGA